MIRTTPSLRLLASVALFAGTILVAGCGSSDKVTKTTTSEQTTSTMPPPVTSSTTTTTRQTQ
jgi:outer membrane murein-binding lipoprotein Lpp